PKDHLSKGSWWEIFGDDQLNRLEKTALKNNHSLKSAMANVEKARAIARISRSEFYPTVDLNPEWERSRTSKNNLTSTSASASSFIANHYSVPFDLSYELDLWGRVRRSFQAGFAEVQATLAEFHTILLTLTADVAQTYFMIYELDKELYILDETIKLRQYAHDMVAKRVEGGLTSELDFNRAKTELSKAKAERIDLVRRRKELEYSLAVLCGQLPGKFSVEKSKVELKAPLVPAGLPSELLERRPDIAEAERRVAAANAEIGVAKAAFFPSISLTTSGGFKSVSTDNLFDWESNFWSIGPSISVPLFAGGRNVANLEAKKAAYQEKVEDYRQTVMESFKEVETSLSNLFYRKEQFEAQNEVLESARNTAELSISRYKQGLVSFLEVVDAERSRLDAELESTQILKEQLISSVQLIKAVGGRW
ncbi:MAG TPA: efflux transporter outer membrane subunit, partial [Candidatus Omnitrophota bacterium]|nr:efflux transporter outer membrane subunit [Candidatus Omnitrophota bacterium]